jgi:hypothetical protein
MWNAGQQSERTGANSGVSPSRFWRKLLTILLYTAIAAAQVAVVVAVLGSHSPRAASVSVLQ